MLCIYIYTAESVRHIKHIRRYLEFDKFQLATLMEWKSLSYHTRHAPNSWRLFSREISKIRIQRRITYAHLNQYKVPVLIHRGMSIILKVSTGVKYAYRAFIYKINCLKGIYYVIEVIYCSSHPNCITNSDYHSKIFAYFEKMTIFSIIKYFKYQYSVLI